MTIPMRAYFAQLVMKEMEKNSRIWVITGDLGYRMWDALRLKFPTRFLNAGASEQAMVGMGVGLALQGKIPFVYSITPFLLYRPFETIRNYIHHERVPVKLIGSGRNKDYGTNGISHWATEDKKVMKVFSHISAHWPETNQEVERIFQRTLVQDRPFYINLKR